MLVAVVVTVGSFAEIDPPQKQRFERYLERECECVCVCVCVCVCECVCV